MEAIIAYTQPNSTWTTEWQIFQWEGYESYHVRTRDLQTDKFSKILHSGTFEECYEYLTNNIN